MPLVCLIDGVGKRRHVEIPSLYPEYYVPRVRRVLVTMEVAPPHLPARDEMQATFVRTREIDDLGVVIYRQRVP